MSTKKFDIFALVTRLIVGGIFIYTGWSKVSDMGMTIGFFSSMHIASFFTYLVAYGELVGGILLILGLWTEIAGTWLVVIMFGAIWFTRAGGFMAFGLPLAMLSGLSAILGAGPGKYALRWKKKQQSISS